MSCPTVVSVPSTSNIMEAIRRHTPQSLAHYPTATYSVQTGRISFAPGTSFNRKLESRVSDRARSTSLNIRPLQDGDKACFPRFRTPRATAPSLFGQSVAGMDYMDPRHAKDYAKWSEIPPWFCRSKSDALVSDRFAEMIQTRPKSSGTDSTFIPDVPDSREADSIDDRADTADEFINLPPRPDREEKRRDSQDSRSTYRSRNSTRSSIYSSQSTPVSCNNFRPLIPHYKPLIGEVYTLRRLDPAHNPWRSLPMGSEVKQYVQHKKKCKGRTVRFTDTIAVMAREPHGGRAPVQRHDVKRRSFDDRQRQKRLSGEIRPNLSIEDVVTQQGRMYTMQDELKDMLQEN